MHVKRVRHTETLFRYDAAQVFEARDDVDTSYVAVLAPPQGEGEDRYLVASVDPERLRRFREGKLDLRSLLIGSDRTTWYLATGEDGPHDSYTLEPLPDAYPDDALLPEHDFTLHDGPTDARKFP